jgi:hypothetical protein
VVWWRIETFTDPLIGLFILKSDHVRVGCNNDFQETRRRMVVVVLGLEEPFFSF